MDMPLVATIPQLCPAAPVAKQAVLSMLDLQLPSNRGNALLIDAYPFQHRFEESRHIPCIPALLQQFIVVPDEPRRHLSQALLGDIVSMLQGKLAYDPMIREKQGPSSVKKKIGLQSPNLPWCVVSKRCSCTVTFEKQGYPCASLITDS